MSNFHAQTAEGANFKSKKALREAVAAGQDVYVHDTSGFDNRGTLMIDQLRPADVIVGPDPYRARNWYANYKNGKVV